MKFKLFAFLIMLAGSVQADGELRILTIGDSLMAAHKISGRSISHSLGRALDQSVTNRSVLGARILYRLPLTGALGMSIPKQFNDANWDWVVITGGGNDLVFGCGCMACDHKMKKMISKDGRSGKIPGLVSKIRKSGARVIYIGYLRSPGVGSLIEGCKDEGDEFEGRIARLAELDRGVYFLSLADLVPHGDRSYHGLDMVHPSLKASREIGQMAAKIIAGQKLARSQ